jgi:sterol desaturase/sphingolipid hydroxylase (fatty acid hydroxylase superfamily)
MPDWLGLDGGGALLPLVPVALFAAVMVGEQFVPRRPLQSAVVQRWSGNAGLHVVAMALVAALPPIVGALGTATETGARAQIALPPLGIWLWMSCAAGIVALDLLMYGLHRLQHAVPLLWRFHVVHHSDVDVDATTALRHHPGELLFNYAVASAAAGLLGLSTEAIAAYGVFALGTQILQHGNLKLLPRTEHVLRLALITPAMHRLHHSRRPDEANANYGNLFSLWDRLFGSFHASTPARDTTLTFGVAGLDGCEFQRFDGMLLTPIRLRARPGLPAAP